MSNIDYEKTLYMKAPFTRLSDALDDLPDNVYLNKTTTGCGATHLCLTNDVHYVVIVPFRSAIANKTNPTTGIKGIIKAEEGVTTNDIIYGVNKVIVEGGVVKIMTTYDSFYKVYDALKDLGLLQQFKLCIDEAHVLTTLAKIKGKCFNFLYKHFREFKAFTFVTATPNNKGLLPSPIQNVEFVRVIWEVSEKVHITEQRVKTIAECNKFVVEICKQHLLGEVEGNAYIYYNSVNEIINVIQKLKKMEDFTPDNVNIFCAENPYNDKKISLQLGKGYTNGCFNDNKKINFLTAANYESCDILDDVGRTYIIVSSKRSSTALTNHLAIPQACGRLRISQYKNEAKMIVCGFSEDIYQRGYKDFITDLDNREATAKHLIERAKHSRECGYEQAYMKDLETFATDPFVIVYDDTSIELNEGARLAELQVYEAFNSFIVAIPNQEIANTIRTIDNNMLTVSDEARFLVEEKVDFSRMLKKYIQSIEEDDVGLTEMIEQRSEIHKQLVEVLGIDRIRSIGFHKTKLMNAYNLTIKFNDNNLNIKSKLSGLRVGGKYQITLITNMLQEIYNNLGINKKAVGADIKNYFVVEKTMVVGADGKRKQGFKIIGDLYENYS